MLKKHFRNTRKILFLNNPLNGVQAKLSLREDQLYYGKTINNILNIRDSASQNNLKKFLNSNSSHKTICLTLKVSLM